VTGTECAGLSRREREIAVYVGRGYTNRESACELFISAKTVEYHLRNIYAKLNTNRCQLRNQM
jgi:DNA-binding CsgD family transcriptional regulator